MSLKRNILDLRKRKEIVLQGGGEDAIKKTFFIQVISKDSI